MAMETRLDPKQPIVFGPFRFDRMPPRLWQGQREIRLRARTLAVPHYLLEHPGQVIGRRPARHAQQ